MNERNLFVVMTVSSHMIRTEGLQDIPQRGEGRRHPRISLTGMFARAQIPKKRVALNSNPKKLMT